MSVNKENGKNIVEGEQNKNQEKRKENKPVFLFKYYINHILIESTNSIKYRESYVKTYGTI